MTEVRRRARSTGIAGGVVAMLVAFACATPACSSDSDAPSGTGGKGATGGKPGTGGNASGGNAGSGGAPATGGKASGGTATGGRATGGADPGPDGGCKPPEVLHYPEPGCNAVPECGGPMFDACAMEVCGCDGTTLSGCGNYSKPWKHTGPCSDGGPGDGGDASTD